MTSPVPNLFLIGAMKSGTTTLHSYLGQHPEIFMCERKEPGYFSRTWITDEREYLSLFASAESANATFRGESSTDYSRAPAVAGVPDRIANAVPNARLVYIMRDPVERAVSQYWYHVRFRGEKREMLAALTEDGTFTQVSDYAYQLEQYASRFPMEQVFVESFEAMVASPQDFCGRLFEWLGVDKNLEFRPRHRLKSPATIQTVRRSVWWSRFRRRNRLYLRLRPLIPAPLRRAAAEFADKVPSPFDRAEQERLHLEAARDYLRSALLPKVRELQALLNREFPEWTTVSADRCR